MDDDTTPKTTDEVSDLPSDTPQSDTPSQPDAYTGDAMVAPGDIEAPTEALNPSHNESYVTTAPDDEPAPAAATLEDTFVPAPAAPPKVRKKSGAKWFLIVVLTIVIGLCAGAGLYMYIAQ